MSLEVRDLSFSVGGKPLLIDVSVTLHPGEILSIIGPNGAGKTTLLRQLAGLEKPTSGTINDDGINLRRMGAKARAKRIAYVAQHTGVLADLSVLDLVLIGRYAHRSRFRGPTSADYDAARAALAKVGMSHLEHQTVPTLSGGERQLVHIARAIAQDAHTLLLDEPTSALDIHHQLRVHQLLRDLAAEGRSIATVLHNLNDAAAISHRLAVIDKGRLVALGPPDDVLTPQLLAQVYRITATTQTDDAGHVRVHPHQPIF